MKTTQVNLQSNTKKGIRDSIIAFMDKPLVKATIILFLIVFMSLIVKAQNIIALKSNSMPLTAMNKNMVKENTITVESVLPGNKPDLLSTANNNLKNDSINAFNNSVSKAKAMLKSYFQGVDDADDNYKARKSGKGLIFVSTLIGGPVVGLIPAIACSSTSPKRKNLDVPSSMLVTSEPYMVGYKGEAHYIKKHNTWPCFVAASVIWVCVVGFLVH